MKRVPLTQLKRILRVGDYVALTVSNFRKVIEVNQLGFSVSGFERRRNWNGTFESEGKIIEIPHAHRTYYWLPGELLESAEIARIKSERRKEQGK